MIQAVIFDLDGVLIDSEPLWEHVRHELVNEHGGRWPADAQDRLMGMSTPEWARYLCQELGVDMPPDQVAAVVVQRMASRYAQHVPVIPGADAALRQIARRWPVALASSSPRALIDVVLTAANWTTLFGASVSTEEVERGKPAPDVYLAAARRLAVAAQSCIAVEDSSNGLRSAAAAGMHLAAIPQSRYPVSPDALHDALVLASLTQLHVPVLEAIQ